MKKPIRLNEAELDKIIKESLKKSLKKILNESEMGRGYFSLDDETENPYFSPIAQMIGDRLEKYIGHKVAVYPNKDVDKNYGDQLAIKILDMPDDCSVDELIRVLTKVRNFFKNMFKDKDTSKLWIMYGGHFMIDVPMDGKLYNEPTGNMLPKNGTTRNKYLTSNYIKAFDD